MYTHSHNVYTTFFISLSAIKNLNEIHSDAIFLPHVAICMGSVASYAVAVHRQCNLTCPPLADKAFAPFAFALDCCNGCHVDMVFEN
ncbi:transmembrane protein, putative [Medicago truncatula]|uniref:Transmembrane protein, putative n=1 Tax=Medicago truncatula TaxID=3880 RepID=G7KGX0_MEDTR|nr:transmembrane protein, putative [Medicago truncatula]